MEGFPSGQREQTVHLSSMTSVVRIHHLPPKEPILIRVSVLFWCQVEWIRKPALRNVPVARFNRRGLPVGRQPLKYLMVVPAAKRIHHRTGRQACSSAVMGLHQPIPAGARPIRRKERSFNDEIYQHGPFVTIYCRLRRYPVGARNHTIRGQTLRLAKSRLRRLLAGRPLRWVCSPYGIYGAKPCLSTNKRSGFIT